MRTLEFIHYDSWATFTDNCCCMSRSSATQSAWATDENGRAFLNATSAAEEPFVELWMCRNASVHSGVSYKERQRRAYGADSIALVRPFCGTTFVDTAGFPIAGYEPYWDAAFERFVVDLRHPNCTVAETVVEYW